MSKAFHQRCQIDETNDPPPIFWQMSAMLEEGFRKVWFAKRLVVSLVTQEVTYIKQRRTRERKLPIKHRGNFPFSPDFFDENVSIPEVAVHQRRLFIEIW